MCVCVFTHFLCKGLCIVSQLEKHRRADQELKKRVLKLEFCLQEARAQTRKLQRVILSLMLIALYRFLGATL